MDWVRPWEALADIARWAPTPHNTQPFRIVPKSAERAELVLLTERLLPREDHGNLYVTSAFGTFARALELAARHHGVELAVEPVPELDTETLEKQGPRVVLGSAMQRARTEPVAADLVLARRTSRLPYHDRAITPVELDTLVANVERGGHRLIVHGTPDIVGPLLQLNAEAILDNLMLEDEREEIRGWYRFGETAEHGDGLWQLPLNQPAWEIRAAFGTPWLYQWPGFRGFAIRRYLRTQRGTRHIALLCGPFSRWPELYRAGRLLLDFWLAMARFGIYMQPMGSMLTNPRYVTEIARRFDVNDCWLVLRLGYSDEPPRAPRLKDIVIHE
jgi:nitroreductase